MDNSTSTHDRFGKLFETVPKPNLASEEAPMPAPLAEIQNSTTIDWNSSARESIAEKESSEDDDYINAFEKKPQMNSKNIKPQRRAEPETDAHGYRKDQSRDPLVPLQYLPLGKNITDDLAEGSSGIKWRVHGLPDKDRFGNKCTGHFCVFPLVQKFPYKYMVDGNDRVSRRFFARDRFFDRKWDIYFVHPPESMNSKPIMLLPYVQVEQLIQEIGEVFKIDVSVPPAPFTMSFFADGTPQAQRLGASTSRDEIDDLRDKIPEAVTGHGEPTTTSSAAQQESFGSFRSKCEKALAANKNNGGTGKHKKEQTRLLKARNVAQQLVRAQQYLGLRGIPKQPLPPDFNLSWTEQEKFRLEQEKVCNITLQPFNLNTAAPFHCEGNPVLVCIDVESYERAHHCITEIGISTLDTMDLKGVAPGNGGENWMNHIRSRHLRIREFLHLVNKDFCVGNPEDFQFGQSEIVSLGEAAGLVDGCFEPPFSAAYKHDSFPADDIAGSWAEMRAALDHATAPSTPEQAKSVAEPNQIPRKIIFVGHTLSADVAYLEKLGSKVFKALSKVKPDGDLNSADASDRKYYDISASIIEALDTATLFQVLSGESQVRKLTAIMSTFGRTAWFAHNGGNDARYTLEALLAITIQARINEDKVKLKPVKPFESLPTDQHKSQEEVAVTSAANSSQHAAENADEKAVECQLDSDDEDWQPY